MKEFLTALAAGGVAFGLAAGPAAAQDEASPQQVSAALAEDPEEGLLSDEELDELVAPVALYPDALLTQVLIASTYPLDVVKADRLIADNEGLEQAALADLAAEEDWDESVRALTAGFPSLVNNMAGEIGWLELLGDAMLVQTEDVLDAVQRQRARADALGNLESNEAQVVEVVDDSITIAPADPQVVYVPTYDPVATYAQPMTAAPVVTTGGVSTSDVLTTGAIAFGSALLINEIFDDDDDYYDDYWRGPRIDWDDAELYPRREVNIDGDVNIDRSRDRNIDRDRVNIDRDRVNVDRDRVNVDRDRVNVDRDRVDIDRDRNRVDLEDRRAKIGDRDPRDRPKEGAWKPDDKRRDDAKDKIADRNDRKGGGQKSREKRDKLKAGAGDRQASNNRPGAGAGAANANRPADRSGARAKLEKASAERKPTKAAGKATRDTALKSKPASAKQTKKAADRGKASVAKAKAPPRPKAAATVERAKAKPAAKRPQLSKPKSVKRPTAKPTRKPTAFKKSGGGRPQAAKARGGKSHGKVKRRR